LGEWGKKLKTKTLLIGLACPVLLFRLVLNNKADQHGIRKDTQERVLSLARQMGYFESAEESDEILPVEEKPGVIGMIVPSMNDPFIYRDYALFAKGICKHRGGFLHCVKGSR
jgi:hypothetical protein